MTVNVTFSCEIKKKKKKLISWYEMISPCGDFLTVHPLQGPRANQDGELREQILAYKYEEELRRADYETLRER